MNSIPHQLMKDICGSHVLTALQKTMIKKELMANKTTHYKLFQLNNQLKMMG